MSRLSAQYLLAAVVGGGTLLALRLVRHFFWSHALMVGLAVAALVFTAWRTLDRQRR